MTRHITHRQEQIYRLRHHNFDGLTTKQVATMLGITTHSVARHMWEMQKIAPQLFPILTKRQADIYHMFAELGLEQKIIAGILGISKSCVGVLIHRLRNKGIYVPRRRRHVLYMPKAHDHLIRMKF
jgi:DNA-binding CsgD family transcriptional regulator